MAMVWTRWKPWKSQERGGKRELPDREQQVKKGKKLQL
jgi:hypothetical protein